MHRIIYYYVHTLKYVNKLLFAILYYYKYVGMYMKYFTALKYNETFRIGIKQFFFQNRP